LILVDANILIYAGVKTLPQHDRAKTWLDLQLSGPTAVGLPWHSLLAFLRITTNPRSFARPLRMEEAWQMLARWLACRPVWIPEPTKRHGDTLKELFAVAGVYGDLVSDAHLVALALEHGLTICTNDRDFARFPNVRWMNPLAS
jgi:hypothetical protein